MAGGFIICHGNSHDSLSSYVVSTINPLVATQIQIIDIYLLT